MIEEVNISDGYYHNIRAFIEIPWKEKEPFPTIIICHGLTSNPAYPVDSHPIYRKISNALVNAGFMTVRFNFTMEMEKDIATFHLKSEEHDLKKVISFLLDYDKADNKKIGVVGHSYGATTLLLISHENNHIKAVSALAPRINLGEEYGQHPWHLEAQEKGFFTHNAHDKVWKISKHFFEENFKHHWRLQHAIKKIKVPLQIIYGTGDEEDTVEAEAIKILNKHAITIPIEKTNHEFTTTAWGLDSAAKYVIDFFRKNL
ncbi:alpha/beta hydrolase family protein [Bacteroidota bacterium]